MPCPRLLSMPLPSCCAQITRLPPPSPLPPSLGLPFQRRPLCRNYTSGGTDKRQEGGAAGRRGGGGTSSIQVQPLTLLFFFAHAAAFPGPVRAPSEAPRLSNTMALICPACTLQCPLPPLPKPPPPLPPPSSGADKITSRGRGDTSSNLNCTIRA